MTITRFFRAHFGNPEPDVKRMHAMGVTIRYGLIANSGLRLFSKQQYPLKLFEKSCTKDFFMISSREPPGP
ncbi:hypothetical protein HNW77_13765 [Komagataeibacter sp. AV436]|uniref:Uncharacterized protein n=1 Tax=Komagataeibacter melomenusus TaxID=2766578 RepID=A0ABX2AGF9_9PROT|nr:hypothetical protein [Komagataeibacter melomenusus]MBV1831697.1 hypothetical protein [Komagataeibacter melomenusus]NPC67428.1 hypothetical protein [Komagataeibacter melomenusus]